MKLLVPAAWERALLVCAKCSRKLGGGFGPEGKTPLAKALRRQPGAGKGRKARIGVVEVKCLGVCPKRAVTVVDTSDPGRWHLVPPGTDVAEIAGGLLADPVPPMLILPERPARRAGSLGRGNRSG